MFKRSLLLLALPFTLGLSGCATDGYYGGGIGYGGGYGYGSPYGYGGGPFAYNGWYDGYYGSIYDGYWGNNGYFYYRGNARDRFYRRGDRNHFHRGPNAPRAGFNALNGSYRHTPGIRAPNFPGRRSGFGQRRSGDRDVGVGRVNRGSEARGGRGDRSVGRGDRGGGGNRGGGRGRGRR